MIPKPTIDRKYQRRLPFFPTIILLFSSTVALDNYYQSNDNSRQSLTKIKYKPVNYQQSDLVDLQCDAFNEDVSQNSVFLHCPLREGSRICKQDCRSTCLMSSQAECENQLASIQSCNRQQIDPGHIRLHYRIKLRPGVDLGSDNLWWCSFRGSDSTKVELKLLTGESHREEEANGSSIAVSVESFGEKIPTRCLIFLLIGTSLSLLLCGFCIIQRIVHCRYLRSLCYGKPRRIRIERCCCVMLPKSRIYGGGSSHYSTFPGSKHHLLRPESQAWLEENPTPFSGRPMMIYPSLKHRVRGDDQSGHIYDDVNISEYAVAVPRSQMNTTLNPTPQFANRNHGFDASSTNQIRANSNAHLLNRPTSPVLGQHELTSVWPPTPTLSESTYFPSLPRPKPTFHWLADNGVGSDDYQSMMTSQPGQSAISPTTSQSDNNSTTRQTDRINVMTSGNSLDEAIKSGLSPPPRLDNQDNIINTLPATSNSNTAGVQPKHEEAELEFFDNI